MGKKVALVALGPTAAGYMELVQKAGSRRAAFDEVWVVNHLTGLLEADLIFHMDDFKIQEARAEAGNTRVKNMLEEMKATKTPIMTSRAYPEYPSATAYPLERVINETRSAYFNSTIAYAMAWAYVEPVDELSLFGLDFYWPNDPRRMEIGKGCAEYWIAKLQERRCHVQVLEYSTLFNGGKPQFYGYDTQTVLLSFTPRGVVVGFEDCDPPTAEEIEKRYTHVISNGAGQPNV